MYPAWYTRCIAWHPWVCRTKPTCHTERHSWGTSCLFTAYRLRPSTHTHKQANDLGAV
jgi:hypothetical protein